MIGIMIFLVRAVKVAMLEFGMVELEIGVIGFILVYV
jgi:hypothetical protein